MERKKATSKSLRKCEKTFFTDNHQVFSDEEKNRILDHLSDGEIYGYTSEPARDFLTGEVLNGKTDNLLSDGVFVWTYSTIYHFKKYNILLEQEFVDYILRE